MAYQRIAVISQLMTMDYDSIVRVASDGIYHDMRPKDIHLQNVFIHKEQKRINLVNGEAPEYCCQINRTGKHNFVFAEFQEPHSKILNLGAGGCGKTHKEVLDSGNISMCLFAPSYKLAQAKKEEYNGLQTAIHFHLLCNDHLREKNLRQFNVWVVDECSMLSDVSKEVLFAFTALHGIKLIFCGDVGYQLGPVGALEMSLTGFDLVREHKTNYRAAGCPVLLELLSKVREIIKKYNEFEEAREKAITPAAQEDQEEAPSEEPEDVRPDTNPFLFKVYQLLIREFAKMNKCITIDQMDYDVHDMIIANSHELKNLYTSKFEDQCSLLQKYVVTKGSSHNYSNGDIIISETKPLIKNLEIRHCHTCHSIQGETSRHKLFIDVSRMKSNPKMLYTALSRAKKIDDIFLITDNGLEEKRGFKGLIYKLTSESGLVYYGHTIKTLDERVQQHIQSANRWKKHGSTGKKCTSVQIVLQVFKAEIVSEDVYYNKKDLMDLEMSVISQNECVNILGKKRKL